uniref:Uncharacterized protein n=1 Tax=Cacopsylla melanoneura TaxID=428564 RepID=A0A8D8Z7D5_9HEMI
MMQGIRRACPTFSAHQHTHYTPTIPTYMHSMYRSVYLDIDTFALIHLYIKMYDTYLRVPMLLFTKEQQLPTEDHLPISKLSKGFLCQQCFEGFLCQQCW